MRLYEELLKVLNKEIRYYEELVMVLDRKQKAIIKSDIEALRQLVAEEQSLVKKIDVTVKERNRVANLIIGRERGGGEVKLKTLIDLAPEEYRGVLTEIKYKLLSNLGQISRLNKENEYLLSFSIDFTRNMARLILDVDSDNVKVYDSRGYTFSPGENNKMLDCQI